ADELVLQQAEMGPDLAIEIGLAPAGPEGVVEAEEEAAQASHFGPRSRSGLVQQELLDEPGQTPPALGPLAQRARAGLRDPVDLALTVALRPLPGALDEARLLQPDERRVERPLVEGEGGLGHLLEPRREPVGVLRAHGVEGAQDDEVERPLQQLDPVRISTRHPSVPGERLVQVHWFVKWNESRARRRSTSSGRSSRGEASARAPGGPPPA